MPHKKSVSTRTTPSASRRFGLPVAADASGRRPARSLGAGKSPSRRAHQGVSPKPRKSQESQSPLSKLTKSVQGSLSSQSTKKLKNISNGGHVKASAMALLAGSAAVALGGRQLQKRKQSAQPVVTESAYTAPVDTSASSPSGFGAPSSVDGAHNRSSMAEDQHDPTNDPTVTGGVDGSIGPPVDAEHPQPPEHATETGFGA